MQKKKGERIKIYSGGEATIISELGSGGQGTVYKVNFNGKEYALKWYHKPGSPEFYKNLKDNIEKGSPSSSFLWPLFLTAKDSKDGCFGYLMELRKPIYKEFSDFLLAKVQFKTVAAMIEAAINICISFQKLHNKGYSYQDLNDGNFFINPENGDVLICDNDNVAPSGVNTWVLGKCRYMAPEIVTKKSMPNTQSDRFSLPVILFLLFFNNHPLEGEQISSCPCMTEKHEKKFYGTSPIFIYDPTDTSNRPVRGIHINVINLWSQFPKYLRDEFISQFSKETMLTPGKRITEKEWLKVLLRMRHELVKCPSCKNELFIQMEQGDFVCSDCGFKTTRMPVLQAQQYKIPIYKDNSIYQYVVDSNTSSIKTVAGFVVESKKTPGLFGIKNQTHDTWVLTTKSGNTRPIAPGETVPALIGNRIAFGNGNNSEII